MAIYTHDPRLLPLPSPPNTLTLPTTSTSYSRKQQQKHPALSKMSRDPHLPPLPPPVKPHPALLWPSPTLVASAYYFIIVNWFQLVVVQISTMIQKVFSGGFGIAAMLLGFDYLERNIEHWKRSSCHLLTSPPSALPQWSDRSRPFNCWSDY